MAATGPPYFTHYHPATPHQHRHPIPSQYFGTSLVDDNTRNRDRDGTPTQLPSGHSMWPIQISPGVVLAGPSNSSHYHAQMIQGPDSSLTNQATSISYQPHLSSMGLQGTLMDRLRDRQDGEDFSSSASSMPTLPPHPDTIFSKSLPHDTEGLLDRQVFTQILRILESSQDPESGILWTQLPLGNEGGLTLHQPLNAYTRWNAQWVASIWNPSWPRDLTTLSWALEMLQLYEMSLHRDVPFPTFADDPKIRQSALRLSQVAPSSDRTMLLGSPTEMSLLPATLFRLRCAGDQLGPYLSQFLVMPVPLFGAYGELWSQKYRFPKSGTDFLAEWRSFNSARNGAVVPSEPPMEQEMRYLRCGRDLAWLIHEELPVKLFLHALQILMASEAPLKPHTPYTSPITQHLLPLEPGDPPLASSYSPQGLSRAALSELISLMAQGAQLAQQVASHHKWRRFMTARPEEKAWLIERVRRSGENPHSLHSVLLNAPVLEEIHRRQGTLLLSQVRREGAPASPSYPSSIAASCGALATILKAFFREDWLWPQPLSVDPDGLGLHKLPLPVPLTVGGEIDKLASNLALGCAWSGRNTLEELEVGLRLGEELALQMLSDLLSRYAEPEIMFSFRLRDGGSLIELK